MRFDELIKTYPRCKDAVESFDGYQRELSRGVLEGLARDIENSLECLQNDFADETTGQSGITIDTKACRAHIALEVAASLLHRELESKLEDKFGND